MTTPALPKKMTADLKQRWLDALRSGRYQQTTGILSRYLDHEDEVCGYCCLGVLCDIIDPRWSPKTGNARYWAALPDNERAYPYLSQLLGASPNIMTEVDAKALDPRIKLVDLNDTQQKNFRVIADWIERNIPAS
jgi:hypothetical protein